MGRFMVAVARDERLTRRHMATVAAKASYLSIYIYLFSLTAYGLKIYRRFLFVCMEFFSPF